MDTQMEKFLQIMKKEMATQTTEITEAVSKKVSENINEKLNALLEENKILKIEVKTLRDTIKAMEEQKRKNNIIFFGVREKEGYESPIQTVIKLIEKDMNIRITLNEVNNAYRLGEKKDNKPRPILVTFISNWRRNEIFRNKKKLGSEIYIKEDLSKEILEKRRELLPQLKEQRTKGKICYFVKDKIVIKEPKDEKRDKRKRDCINSPDKYLNPATSPAPKKINKTNMLDYVARGRSTSLSLPTTSKNV